MPTTKQPDEAWLERAAQAWCAPTTSHLVMEPALAEVFASMLAEVREKALEEAIAALERARGSGGVAQQRATTVGLLYGKGVVRALLRRPPPEPDAVREEEFLP